MAWIRPQWECRAEQHSWTLHCYKCGTRRLKDSAQRAKKEAEGKKGAKHPAAGLLQIPENICKHYLGPVGGDNQEQEDDDDDDEAQEDDETEEMDKPSAARFASLKRQLAEMEGEEEGVFTQEEIGTVRENMAKVARVCRTETLGSQRSIMDEQTHNNKTHERKGRTIQKKIDDAEKELKANITTQADKLKVLETSYLEAVSR